MASSTECSQCGRTFANGEALKQHRAAVHGNGSGIRWGSWLLWGTLAALLVGGGYWAYGAWGTRPLPRPGDHWHADYEIVVCGRTLPHQPYSQGDVHTHGSGRIHVHPHTRETAGRRANLGRFVRSLGGRLGDTVLVLPDGRTYRNGDRCGNEPGRVSVYVNGRRLDRPARYVPRDGDRVRITYEPRSEA